MLDRVAVVAAAAAAATEVDVEAAAAGVGLGMAKLFSFVLVLDEVAKVLERFLMMVSPSGVTIFLGHRLSLVCLMRPFR